MQMNVGILVCQVKLVPNYREENTSQKLSRFNRTIHFYFHFK